MFKHYQAVDALNDLCDLVGAMVKEQSEVSDRLEDIRKLLLQIRDKEKIKDEPKN